MTKATLNFPLKKKKIKGSVFFPLDQVEFSMWITVYTLGAALSIQFVDSGSGKIVEGLPKCH